MFTLEELERDWNKAVAFGTEEERMACAARWNAYYSHLAAQQRGRGYRPNVQAQRTVAYMYREKRLRAGDSVLDIGAGTGGYALEMARFCREVTALDANQECLEVLAENAGQAELGNITVQPGFWEAYQGREKYNLVFSALCPAICDTEQLRRMEAYSKRTVCLLSVMRGSYEKHRREMIRRLGIQPAGMNTEAIYYYNALYLMGRCPDMKCWSSEVQYPLSRQEVLARFPVYFKVFGVPEEQSLPFLQSYLDENAVDGVLMEECRLNLALISWEVPQQTEKI